MNEAPRGNTTCIFKNILPILALRHPAWENSEFLSFILNLNPLPGPKPIILPCLAEKLILVSVDLTPNAMVSYLYPGYGELVTQKVLRPIGFTDKMSPKGLLSGLTYTFQYPGALALLLLSM